MDRKLFYLKQLFLFYFIFLTFDSIIAQRDEESLLIYQLGNEPKIDGVADPQWFEIPKTRLVKYLDNDMNGLPNSPVDLSSYWRVAWDEANFYFFISVKDEEINTTAIDPWDNDGIEIFLDGDNSKNNSEIGYDFNDEQCRFIINEVPTAINNHININAIEYKYKLSKSGYNIEIRIPFLSLNFTPQQGSVIGIEFLVNDNDEGSCQDRLSWWSYDVGFAWMDASLFGTALLVENKFNKNLVIDEYQLSELLLPKEYFLNQNFPNPFNPTTKIKYSLPQSSNVSLKVFDILGCKIVTLVDQVQDAGFYEMEFNAKNLSSGIYFYRIETDGFVATKKMSLLK